MPPGFGRKRIKWSTLSYVVVDELSPEVAALVVTEWPRLDRKGRLRFPGSTWRVGASVEELDAALLGRRLPGVTLGLSPGRTVVSEVDPAQTRAIRIGDAFAVVVKRPPGRITAVPALSRWLQPPIYDVSADARDAAKAALYAAVAPTMSEADVGEIAAEAMDLKL